MANVSKPEAVDLFTRNFRAATGRTNRQLDPAEPSELPCAARHGFPDVRFQAQPGSVVRRINSEWAAKRHLDLERHQLDAKQSHAIAPSPIHCRDCLRLSARPNGGVWRVGCF